MSNDISETIVIMILEKLISKACRDSVVKEINSHFNNHCNKYISKLLIPYLNTPFIFHENGLDMIENNSNDIFYNSILPKKLNTWVSFSEPNCSIIDRSAFNKNKLTKNIEVKNGIIKMKSIEVNNILAEQREFEKEKTEKTNKNNKTKKGKIKLKLKDIWKKDHNDNNGMDKNNIKRNLLIDKKKINTNIENKNNNEIEEKKEKEKEIILEIPGTFIPYENHEKINIILNNTEENNFLRKERELIILEKEEMLKNEKNKKLKPKQSKVINKKFNYEKITFDSNGNIIKLNLPRVDSFSKDFIMSKPKIKEKKDEIIPEKNDINNKNKNEIINNKKKLKIIESKLKIPEKNKIHNLENNDKNNIKIEYNPEGRLDELFIKSSKKKIDNIPQAIYSGSNFEKITPEIGVIISNNDNKNNYLDKEKINKKIGGFEYIKKYNRPSMNEISNLLSSQNSNINIYNNQITSFFNYDYSKNINNNKNEINEKNNSQFNYNTENNYIGYKEDFKDNNPLFQGAMNIKEETQNNKNKLTLKNKKSFSNENIFNSKGKIKVNSRMKKNISYQINPLYNNHKILMNINKNLNTNNNYLSSVNNILLSDNFNSPNLKSIFLDENENKIGTNNNSVENKVNNDNENANRIKTDNIIYPLKDLKYRKNILPIITENNNKDKNAIKLKYINKFNFGIINNKNWGNIILDDLNINNKNSYKEQFLIQKNRFLKTPNNIKISKNKDIQIENFNQRNKSKVLNKTNSLKIIN